MVVVLARGARPMIEAVGLPLDEDLPAFLEEATGDVLTAIGRLKGKDARDPAVIHEAARLAARQWALATDLAAALGRHCGLSRHRAEALTEAVIRDGLTRGSGPETLSAEAFARVAADLGITGARLTQDQIDAALDPRAYVERR